MGSEEIRKAIRAMMEGLIPINSSWCKVKKVEDQTCTVEDEGLEIPGILLGFDKSGVIIYPKVNSDVLVAFIDNTNTMGAVIMVEETDDMEIMGKNFGGIPILQKIQDNLNAIKNYLSVEKNAISSAFAAIGAGTSANGAAGQSSFNAAMASQTINFSDMENKKVKHGDGS